jgi:hypothetical protein
MGIIFKGPSVRKELAIPATFLRSETRKIRDRDHPEELRHCDKALADQDAR